MAGSQGEDLDFNNRDSGGSTESHGPVSPVEQQVLVEEDDDYEDEEESEDEESPQSSTPSGEPRPEFLREWSFSRATAAVQSQHKSKRSSKSQAGPKKKSKKTKALKEKEMVVDMEDFFGIMSDHSLPPLPTPAEALEMPPVYIEPASTFGFGILGASQSYDKAPRSSMRVASVVNPTGGVRRPPVARSAYIRESFESNHQDGSFSSTNSNQLNNTSSPHGSISSNSNSNSSGSISGNAIAFATSAVSAKALSRMSLQGLSSAFSGLGGYLTSQSGSAVSVAANATRMCNGNGEISPVHENVLNLGGNSESVDWIEARRRESSENDGFYQGEDDDDMHPAVRKAIGNSSNGPFSSISSRNSESSNKFSNSSNFKRRFLSKEECQKPIETPIWLLDFERSTMGKGAGPLIML